MNLHAWRWPLAVGMAMAAGGILILSGKVHPVYQGQMSMAFSGTVSQIDAELAMFRSRSGPQVIYEKVPGQPLQLVLRTDGPSHQEILTRLTAEAQADSVESLKRRKAGLQKTLVDLQKPLPELEARATLLDQERKSLVAGSRRRTPRAELVAQIEALKARRALLIEHYPSHTDIAVLGAKIQDLLNQLGSRPAPLAEKVTDVDRRMNEVKLRHDYFSRRVREVTQEEQALKPFWRMLPLAAAKRPWPKRVEGWPLGLGVVFAIFAAALWVLKRFGASRVDSASNGLWRTEADRSAMVEPDHVPAAPVTLEVVSPEPGAVTAAEPEQALPSDPLVEKAAALYAKWIDVAEILYKPAAEAPQGVLDQVGPLLNESNDFLLEGHDVLARVLARSVAPGDLAAHVARTVLMTLTGAQEAGVSPEHRLAMALAALFHDLSMVSRAPALQDEVGSEVGRLSAPVLRRIPGLEPALLAMVEDILVGMDEFKLDTWQNVAHRTTLEPLSKVLREIDRFEKLMQKQKSRLTRRLSNQ